ncbi:ABC transporter permease [bacterium]|nr:ABC transporter permease [bacterium]
MNVLSVMMAMAWRNLFRHIGKSIVIGTILFLGALIMTVGNGVVTGLDDGLALNFRKRVTGDLVVISRDQLKENIFFTPMAEPVEPIEKLESVTAVLDQTKEIRRYLPAAKGAVMVLNGDSEPTWQMLIGVDLTDFQSMFEDSMITLEGSLPKHGERGLLLSTQSRSELYKFANFWTVPKDAGIVTANLPADLTGNVAVSEIDLRHELIFMGNNDRNTSFDIIAPIRTVFKYRAFNGMWGFFSLIDIDSYRECMGFFSEADQTKPVSGESQALLNASLIFVKLAPGASIDSTIKSLNQTFKKQDIPARAISWKDSLGQVSGLALLMRGVLFGFVMFVFFVAIIIITNTLSLAAIERITEIGMMRAIGAQRWFISGLFVCETICLSVIFGGLGIAAGTITVKALAMARIPATNDMIELFFGGSVFLPRLTTGDILLCVLQLTVVTILAVIYPVIVARRITPLEAIARE